MIRKFFADANFLTGLFIDKDDYHTVSKEIYEYLIDKHLISDTRDFYISNYILTEVIHNFQAKRVKYKELMEKYELLKQCKVYHIQVTDIDEAFKTKLAPYRKHGTDLTPPIGIVDATNLIVMDKIKNCALISFDSGYASIPDPFLIRIYNTKTIDEKIFRRFKY